MLRHKVRVVDRVAGQLDGRLVMHTAHQSLALSPQISCLILDISTINTLKKQWFVVIIVGSKILLDPQRMNPNDFD